MLHTVYLASLCNRRQWPEPLYQITASRYGFICVVRVNNREYQTSEPYSSASAAKEGAALTAYTICRSFSVNDGMYPTGFAHGNVIQGRAVPVGSGRTNRNSNAASTPPAYRYRGESISSGDSRSGGSSPDFADEPGLALRRHNRPSGTYTLMRNEPQHLRHATTRR